MLIKIRKQGDGRRLLGQTGTQTALVPIASPWQGVLCPPSPLASTPMHKPTHWFKNFDKCVNILSQFILILFFQYFHILRVFKQKMGSAEFSEASILSDLKCQSSKSVDRGCQAHFILWTTYSPLRS